MRSLLVLVLFTLGLQAHATDMTTNVIAYAEGSTNDFADKLVTNILDMALNAWPRLALQKAGDPTLPLNTPAVLRPRAANARVFASRPDDSLSYHQDSQREQDRQLPTGRREALAMGGFLGFTTAVGERHAIAGGETSTFYGTAFPPAQFGGYVADAKEKAVYTFDFPEDWKLEPPSKVEKGTKNIDGKVFNPNVPNKGEQAIVVVLSRAGEDNAAYELKDPKQSIMGVTSAELNLLEALREGDVTFTKTTKEGNTFFDYVVKDEVLTKTTFLVSITVGSGGRLFALLVKAANNVFNADEGKLKSIISSFRLTGK